MKRILLIILVLAVAIWLGMRWAGETAMRPLADDLVRLDEPLPGASVRSPLTVRGSARGTWFFEASFPVILKDDAGNVLAIAPAMTSEEWMTTEFVPFDVALTFETDAKQGTLELHKDNPSGLPEYDDSRAITVYFE